MWSSWFGLLSLLAQPCVFLQRNYSFVASIPAILSNFTNQSYPVSFGCQCPNDRPPQSNLVSYLHLVCLISQSRAYLVWLDSCAKEFSLLFSRGQPLLSASRHSSKSTHFAPIFCICSWQLCFNSQLCSLYCHRPSASPYRHVIPLLATIYPD